MVVDRVLLKRARYWIMSLTEEKHDVFTWLPAEVVLHVFGYLQFQDLVAISATCKTLHEVGEWQCCYFLGALNLPFLLGASAALWQPIFCARYKVLRFTLDHHFRPVNWQSRVPSLTPASIVDTHNSAKLV